MTWGGPGFMVDARGKLPSSYVEISMASRPFLQKIAKVIDRLGGEEWVFDRIADGRSIQSIVDEIADAEPSIDSISRPMLYQWRDLKKDVRRELWELARKASAFNRLEDGEKILDDLAESGHVMPAEVSLANSRANYRMALAKLCDPGLDPKKADVNVQVSVGTLHLDALRKLGGGSARRLGDGSVQEAEVLAVED